MVKKMQEVSDRVIVLLVIVAIIVSVIGTFVVTSTAFNLAEQRQNSPVIQKEIQVPDNTAGVVSVTVVSKDDGGDSIG